MSPTFYEQIYANIFSPKKYKTQTVGEKLFKTLPCKKAARKCCLNCHLVVFYLVIRSLIILSFPLTKCWLTGMTHAQGFGSHIRGALSQEFKLCYISFGNLFVFRSFPLFYGPPIVKAANNEAHLYRIPLYYFDLIYLNFI